MRRHTARIVGAANGEGVAIPDTQEAAGWWQRAKCVHASIPV